MKIRGRGLILNLALLITSTILALFLGEIIIRLLGWSPLYVSPERDRFWKYDSLLGWTHQPGQTGVFETRQFRTSVQINQKGLRDRDHSYERLENIQRILVMGDSFAWGYGVEANHRFSNHLETAIGAEVINAGVSGYSTDQELLWFRDEGVKYSPDLVILIFTGNDIGDNHRQLVNTIYYKPQFVREEDQLILKGYPVPKTGPEGIFVYSMSQRSALAYFLIQRYFDFLTIYRDLKVNSAYADSSVAGTSSASEHFGLTITLIDEMRNIAEALDAKFLIVASDRWWNGRPGETYEDFIDTLQTEGFLVLDVESMPGFDPEEMLIPDDGHWSRAGHEFVAKKIQNLIEEKRLLSLPQNQ